MNKLKIFLKSHKNLIILLLLVITFFSSKLVITFDTTHYLTYVDIFEKNREFYNWDIVRGPIFPFLIFISNNIFGKNVTGILLLMFFFYIVYCYITYQFINLIYEDVKCKKVLTIISCLFCFFNPLILGYFHTLLTEFVAITFTMIFLSLSWKWWEVKGTKNKFFYSICYIIGVTFSYFLKQPYVCIVILPMMISIIYALINNHSFKHVMYYFGTLILSVIVLVISMFSWNKILESKGVDMNSGRDSGNMLSKQIINSIDFYKTYKVKKYNEIKNDSYFTKKEKRLAKKVLKKNKILVVEMYSNKKLVEKDFITIGSNGTISGSDTIKEVMNTGFKHPALLSNCYLKSYCALSSVCKVSSKNGVMYHVTNEKDFLHTFENEFIPYRSFKQKSSVFYYPEERFESVKNYIETSNQSAISKILSLLFIPTSIVFKFVILLMSLFLLILVAFRIRVKKKVIHNRLYLFSLLMLSSSFITLIANVLVGSILDRYATICFIPGLLGIIGTIIYVAKSRRNSHEKRKK